MSNAPLEQSGVWRYRELFPFLDSYDHVVTLREGNTPALDIRQSCGIWRHGQHHVPAPGLQPDRIVQGQRYDRWS